MTGPDVGHDRDITSLLRCVFLLCVIGLIAIFFGAIALPAWAAGHAAAVI